MIEWICALALGGAVALAATVPATAGPFEDGQAAFRSGDYPTALQIWCGLADRGDARAEFELGAMYVLGRGVPQDDRQAILWFRQSAAHGGELGQKGLAEMYLAGRDEPQDYAHVAIWCQKAAAIGNSLGPKCLSLMYARGDGVAKDAAQARLWLGRWADQGDPIGIYNLGEFEIQNQPPDYAQAYVWFDLAASRVPQSNAMHDKALQARESAASHLSASQMVDARALSAAWSQQHRVSRPAVILNPDWVRTPTAQQFPNYYPERAQRMGIEGQASISCLVTAEGTLTDCSVLSEDPPDQFFGNAALSMASLFKMKPQTINGQPVGGARITVPIRFRMPRPSPPPSDPGPSAP